MILYLYYNRILPKKQYAFQFSERKDGPLFPVREKRRAKVVFMGKITFMGAGSTVFAKNVLGDVMLTEALQDFELALYDIDGERLEESYIMIDSLNRNINQGRAKVSKYLGVENRKDALRGADFVVDAIQVGGYDPCTIIDFEIPKKYGLRQTIADTLGIGGLFRTLRTIPVLQGFAEDMEEVCPNALFLNYTNPMATLSGYMQRYTNVKTVGLCHSVQHCATSVLKAVGIDPATVKRPFREKIAGINHMAWLLELYDADGKLVTADRYMGKTIDVKGIVDYYDGAYQIKVFSANDITIH